MRIIAGFPGVGKSHFSKHHEGVLDSDSSKFSGDKENFPQNYIDHIKKSLDRENNTKCILVSTHKVVIDALIQEGFDFMIVKPALISKDVYLQRYRERGNDEAFIAKLDENWENFLEDLSHASTNVPSIVLQENEFISDIFEYTPENGLQFK